MSNLKISSNQFFLTEGNLYLFTTDIYNSNDPFYLWTNNASLIAQNTIIIYNTLYRNIDDIVESDVVGNIYLYKQWSDGVCSAFKRVYTQEQQDKEAAMQAGTPIIVPETMITNLRDRNTVDIRNPNLGIKNPTSSHIVYVPDSGLTTVNISYIS